MLLLLLYLLCGVLSVLRPLKADQEIKVTVVMTTIPPRYASLRQSLPFWFQQETPIDRICLFIPRQYRRFRKKRGNFNPREGTYQMLERILREDVEMSQLLDQTQIKLIAIDADWGPITRFVGLINEVSETNSNAKACYAYGEAKPDFWLVADDDVGYLPTSLNKYLYHLHLLSALHTKRLLVLTNFSRDVRLFFHVKGESEPHFPVHVQAVDTYLLPHLLPSSPPLHSNHTIEIIQFFHTICPESFYQDDYIVSFLLCLYGYDVQSMWSNDNLAVHLEGLSKDHYQMHMDEKVFEREEQTKRCIYTYASVVHNWLKVKTAGEEGVGKIVDMIISPT